MRKISHANMVGFHVNLYTNYPNMIGKVIDIVPYQTLKIRKTLLSVQSQELSALSYSLLFYCNNTTKSKTLEEIGLMP